MGYGRKEEAEEGGEMSRTEREKEWEEVYWLGKLSEAERRVLEIRYKLEKIRKEK